MQTIAYLFACALTVTSGSCQEVGFDGDGSLSSTTFRRVRREIPSINDTEYDRQRWYLSENDIEGKRRENLPSLRIEEAWGQGYTGQGVIVMVVDDGIHPENPEIKDNLRLDLCLNGISGEADPSPFFEDSHGTEVAGVIAAKANNGRCGVGVAYEASIAGVALPFDVAEVTDEMEAIALTHALSDVDIYSNSWGPPEGTYILGTVGPLAINAITEGSQQGRDGKGAIYVWAAGNGGINGNHCGYDGYVNLMYTIPVSAVGADGRKLGTSEECSAVMVTGFAGDGSFTVPDDKVITTEDRLGTCVDYFSDTSAATPMIAGAIALALQANSDLTWVDVHHLIALSSNPDVLDPDAFITNQANMKVSPSFGFGLLDAAKLTKMAKRWRGVPQVTSCVLEITSPEDLPGHIYLDPHSSQECAQLKYIDHAQVTVDLVFAARGHISIELESPLGTKSMLLPGRFRDVREKSLNWTVDSVHFWGESAVGSQDGRWLVSLENKYPQYNSSGVVDRLELVLHGLVEPPHIPDLDDDDLDTSTERPLTEAASKEVDFTSGSPLSKTSPSVLDTSTERPLTESSSKEVDFSTGSPLSETTPSVLDSSTKSQLTETPPKEFSVEEKIGIGVGVALACLAVILCIVLGVCYMQKRRRKSFQIAMESENGKEKSATQGNDNMFLL